MDWLLMDRAEKLSDDALQAALDNAKRDYTRAETAMAQARAKLATFEREAAHRLRRRFDGRLAPKSK